MGRGDEQGGKGGRGGSQVGELAEAARPRPRGGGQAGLRLPPAPLSPFPPISAMSEKVRPLSSPKGAETRSSTPQWTEPGCPSRGLSRAPRPACSSRQDRSRPASGPLQVPPGQESRGVAPANEARAWAAAQAPRARRPPSCFPGQETPCVLHHVFSANRSTWGPSHRRVCPVKPSRGLFLPLPPRPVPMLKTQLEGDRSGTWPEDTAACFHQGQRHLRGGDTGAWAETGHCGSRLISEPSAQQT